MTTETDTVQDAYGRLVHPTETDIALAEMLTENTGRHFLDSGGAYGRNWERNQGLTVEDFLRSKDAILSVHDYSRRDGEINTEVSVTVNLFHYLRECADYNPRLTELFYRWASLTDPDNDRYWTDLAEDFATRRCARWNGGGIYGDGSGPATGLTYNEDNVLSQDFQYVYWEDETGSYALVEIHGGCDIRGGYTKPRVFDTSVDGNGALGFFDWNRASVWADSSSDALPDPQLDGMPARVDDSHGWDTYYDGYSLSPYDGHGYRAYPIPDGLPEILRLDEYALVESEDATLRNVIRKDDAGIYYSPVNGMPLHAGMY